MTALRLMPAGLLLGVGLFLAAPFGTDASAQSGEPAVRKSLRHAAMGLLTVYTFQFDPAQVSMRLLFPDKPGTLAEVRDMKGCAEAEVCVNGSFFTESNRAIGLLVSAGQQVQGVKNISWGVFWIGKDGKAHIQRRKDYEESVSLSDVDFAVQSGPTVMWDGTIREDLGRGLARRVAVGIGPGQWVSVLVFPWPISLPEMARFARDRLQVSTLMNLDGGGSVQAYVPGDDSMRVSGEGVAVGIGLFKK